MSEALNPTARDRIFPGDSEMAQRMRALDWSRTPVGPIETWPQNLKSTVKTLLVSRYPMVLTWGPEFTQFYNDAYRRDGTCSGP